MIFGNRTREVFAKSSIRISLALAVVATLFGVAEAPARAQGKKPIILVIWGDDIAYDNISAYNHGIMGYRTPGRWFKSNFRNHLFVFSDSLDPQTLPVSSP